MRESSFHNKRSQPRDVVPDVTKPPTSNPLGPPAFPLSDHYRYICDRTPYSSLILNSPASESAIDSLNATSDPFLSLDLSPTSTTMQSPRPHKQSMAELKLRRLTEHNQRLREDLARPRVRVSEASVSLIRFCTATKDPMLPTLWGAPSKGEDPYAPPDQGGCCTVM